MGVKMLFGLYPVPCNAAAAVQLLTTAADQHNHASAMALLSYCHCFGIGTVVNHPLSARYAVSAARLHSAIGCYQLGLLFEHGQYDKPCALPSAPPSPPCHTNLRSAECFSFSGWGVAVSRSEASSWYAKAASQADTLSRTPEGIYFLARMYRWGSGVDQNVQKSVELYRTVAQGNTAAAADLVNILRAGEGGVAKDEAEAVRLLKDGAERGDKECQNHLGWCYETGSAIETNWKTAYRWYMSAAQQGYSLAQYNIGICLKAGRGMPTNEDEAIKWFLKAANQNNEDAQFELAELYRARRRFIDAAPWLKIAAESGNVQAMRALADMYRRGEGTPVQLAEAVKWTARADEKAKRKSKGKKKKKIQSPLTPLLRPASFPSCFILLINHLKNLFVVFFFPFVRHGHAADESDRAAARRVEPHCWLSGAVRPVPAAVRIKEPVS